MSLRILRWGDCSEWSRWAQCNHKGPYKDVGKGIRGGGKRRGNEAEGAAMCSEDGQRGHEPRKAGGLQKTEMARETNRGPSWEICYCPLGRAGR